VLELTWRQVVAWRLARSHLLAPAPHARLVDVVRDVALIQAQVLSAAEIGICVRVADVTAADVRRELYDRRSLVKTWSIRGTLHLVPADELPLWAAAARGPRPFWESRSWLAKYGLTARSASALFDAIADALVGSCLTRAELADEVAARELPKRLRLFRDATSLGGVESLIEWRRKHDPEAAPALLRISVGLEDADDLAADLAQGLAAVGAERA
jgi:hypothetical protein